MTIDSPPKKGLTLDRWGAPSSAIRSIIWEGFSSCSFSQNLSSKNEFLWNSRFSKEYYRNLQEKNPGTGTGTARAPFSLPARSGRWRVCAGFSQHRHCRQQRNQLEPRKRGLTHLWCMLEAIADRLWDGFCDILHLLRIVVGPGKRWFSPGFIWSSLIFWCGRIWED